MKGLLLKDFFNLAVQWRSIGLVILFYLVFSVIIGNINFAAPMIVLIIVMQAITTFSFDRTSKWDSYALSLPVNRKKIVGGKYIFTVLLLVFATALSLITTTILSVFSGNVPTAEQGYLLIGLFTAALLIMGLMLPLIFKFGVEKSRILLILCVAIPSLLIYFLTKSGIQPPSAAFIKSALISSPFIAVIWFYISYRLSIHIFSQKNI